MEGEESRIKEEAKILIAKTKRLINSITPEKDNNFSNSRHSLSPLSNPQLDSPIFPPSRHSNIIPLDKNLINTTLLNSKTDLKISIKNLTKRVSEMSIQIKQLENENKVKDEIILSLQKKLYSSSNKIGELNQKIIDDRNNSAEVENSRLKRKIAALEKTLNDNTFMYEEIINEYKMKLNKITFEHQGNFSKLMEVSNSKERLLDTAEKMKNDIDYKNCQLDEMKEKNIQSGYREKDYLEKIRKLKEVIKQMVYIIKKVQMGEEKNYLLRRNLLDKIKVVFKN